MSKEESLETKLIRAYNQRNDVAFDAALKASDKAVRKTLSGQVSDLADRCIRLEGLAGEMLATIELNFKRGYLKVHNDEGKLNLEKILAKWDKELNEERS